MIVYYVLSDGSLLRTSDAILRADGLLADERGVLVVSRGYSHVTKRADLSDEEYEAQKPRSARQEPSPDIAEPDVKTISEPEKAEKVMKPEVPADGRDKPAPEGRPYKTRQSKAGK